MRCRFFSIFFMLGFLIPNELYKQIKITNVASDDISLFQGSGIDIDHANYVQGQFIEFAISQNDLSSESRFPFISRTALFLAEIPSNLKKIGLDYDEKKLPDRFTNISGFIGTIVNPQHNPAKYKIKNSEEL